MRARFDGLIGSSANLVAVMLWLERAFDGDADVVRLFFVQCRQLYADTVKVQARNLFIQMLGQDVNARLVFVALGPQLNLREHLVGEGCGHHKRRVACCVTKVQQTPLGQQDQAVAVWHLDHIDLFFDVGPLVVLQARHLNFIVKVADVTNDRHILHLANMLDADHVLVACSGNKDIGSCDNVFERRHLKTVHRRLQCADRVNLGHDHTCARARQGRSRAFANIAVAHDHSDLAGHHRVSRAANAVDEAFLTTVFIVEFRLGLPTKNFLSKSDLLEPEELEKILEWSERLEILEMALYDEAGGQRTEFAINQLRMMQEFAQAPGLTPLSSELEEGLADILTFAQALFGGMSDARDGFASDIEHEKN